MKNLPQVLRGLLTRAAYIFYRDDRTSTDVAMELDLTHGAVKFVDVLHNRTHARRVFDVTHVQSLAAGASVEILLKVPETIECHTRFSFTTGGQSSGLLYEAPTITADGTPMSVVNRNRKTPVRVSEMEIFSAPTLTGNGTLLTTQVILASGGIGQSIAGGQVGTFEEWLLKPGQNYLWKTTNDETLGTEKAWLGITFYENELDL